MKTEIERTTTTRVVRTLTLEEIERILIDHWYREPGVAYSVEWDDCGEGGVMGATITYEKTERVVE